MCVVPIRQLWSTTNLSENSETDSCIDRYSSQFNSNDFTEMCSASKAGSYLRLIDFEFYSTIGLRVIQKKSRRIGNESGMIELEGINRLAHKKQRLAHKKQRPPSNLQ